MGQSAARFTTVLAVVAFGVLGVGAALAPPAAAAPMPREEPHECKELGPASPRCTLARDQQMKERLTPRACTKYGADSPQCERATKKGPAFLVIMYPSAPARRTKFAHFQMIPGSSCSARRRS